MPATQADNHTLSSLLPFEICFEDQRGVESFRWKGFGRSEQDAIENAITSFGVIWRMIHYCMKRVPPEVPAGLLNSPKHDPGHASTSLSFELRGAVFWNIVRSAYSDFRAMPAGATGLLEEFLRSSLNTATSPPGNSSYEVYFEYSGGRDDDGEQYLMFETHFNSSPIFSSLTPAAVDLLIAIGTNVATCDALYTGFAGELLAEIPSSATMRAAEMRRLSGQPLQIPPYLALTGQTDLLLRLQN